MNIITMEKQIKTYGNLTGYQKVAKMTTTLIKVN